MKQLVFAIFFGCAMLLQAQELLDRVVARVDGQAITLSDARAAAGFGLVDIADGADPIASATRGLIERQLMLVEVARFSPPEPDSAALDREAATLRERAGSGLAALMISTGVNDARVRELARDSLRIQAYLNQRFGVMVQVTDEEAAQYYRMHPDEFRRDGQLIPFEEAASRARERASAERRRTTIDQWVRDLRARADILCQLDDAACKIVLEQ